jgi:hypothetical protein
MVEIMWKGKREKEKTVKDKRKLTLKGYSGRGIKYFWKRREGRNF